MNKIDADKLERIQNLLDDSESIGRSPAQLRMMSVHLRDMMMTDEERISPDTYGCDCLFIRYFITDDMEDDFPLIAKDFLQHEMPHLKEYAMPRYVDFDMNTAWPKRALQIRILDLIVSAWRKGNAYCAQLLQSLYKTYYKKEYRQLKRFSRLSPDEVISLADDEHSSPTSIARILTAAAFFGIKISPDCSFLYLTMDDLNKDMQAQDDDLYDFSYWSDEDVNAAKKDVEEMFSNKDLLRTWERKGRLSGMILKYLGYPDDYLETCDTESYTLRQDYEIALLLLRKTWPQKTFSKDQIADAALLLHALRAFTDTCDDLTDEISYTLGTDDGDFYENFPSKFIPPRSDAGKAGARQTAPAPEKPAPAVIKQAAPDEEHYSQEALLKEIDRLRDLTHSLEAANQDLRLRNRELTNVQSEVKRIREEYENDKRELAALREHVYHFTQADTAPDRKTFEEMKSSISRKKIVIIGGHSNWVNKLRNLYPEWNFVSADASGAVNPHVVENADYVYFFTDTIGHSTYYRFVQLLREQKIPFGYIHGVNIESNTAQIYQDLCE